MEQQQQQQEPSQLDQALVRAFDTGATRSSEVGRYDPEGFMSPIVVERFCEYMNRNRLQPDGTVRDSDNWQKGIPLATYVKGMWRHFLHLWTRHRGYQVQDPKAADNMEDDLCAIIFNAHGMLFERLKDRQLEKRSSTPKPVGPENTRFGGFNAPTAGSIPTGSQDAVEAIHRGYSIQ